MRVIIQALFLLMWFAGAAEAHFFEGVKVRSIVVTRDGDGVTVFVRTPAPLLFGELLDAAQRTGAPPDTGFIYSRERETGPVFYLSRDAIDADPEGFAARLENALAWSQNGQPLRAKLAGFVLHDFLQETAFDSAQTAALREAYADDLFWLRAGADGLATLIEENGPGQAGEHPPTGQTTRGHDNDDEERRMA